MTEKIKIELCGGKMPIRAHQTDAAFDVFVKEDTPICPNARFAVPLGFKIELPRYLGAVIQPRSGMTLKGLVVMAQISINEYKKIRINADVEIGLVDCGYTGEVKALVHVGSFTFAPKMYIPAGTKIAQMRIVEIPDITLEEGIISKDTERGDKGFNSTGTK